MRITGLPSVARYPEATVTSDEEAIHMLFGGGEHETRMSVPLKYLGRDTDPEAAELRLLAQLKQLGYRVSRNPPGS